jgi:hypothetical protein
MGGFKMNCLICKSRSHGEELMKIKNLENIEVCKGCNWMVIRERIKRISSVDEVEA